MNRSGEKEALLVSACLIGVPCRYDGRAKPHPGVVSLAGRYALIPVCPEQLGGLSTPRPPAERMEATVCRKDGVDVTEAFQRGARICLYLAELLDVKRGVFKDGSPSCGSTRVYDGHFSGCSIAGAGVTTDYLRSHGLTIYPETALSDL